MTEPGRKRGVWVGAITYGFAAMAIAVAGLDPDPRTWGLHALAFLPRVAWVAALGVLVLLVVPHAATWLGEAPRTLGLRVLASPWRVIAVSILACGFFYWRRLEFQFLGDGAVWLRWIGTDEPFHHFEPLATFFVRTVARLSSTPVAHAGLFSVGLGLCYVALTALLCRRAWRDPASSGLGWLLLLLHPAILLFFGYVESYPLLLVLQVLFAMELLRVARTASSLLGPALVLAIAIASHLQAVSWLPALVAVVVVREHGDWKRSIARAGAWCAGILGGSFAILIALDASPTALVAALGGESALGAISASWFFSGGHALDLANELSLLLLVPGLLAAGAWAAGFRLRDLEPHWIPISWMLPGPFLFAVTVQPRIGAARDWDLYLSVTLPAVLLAVEAWSRVWGVVGGKGFEAARTSAGQAQAGRVLGLAGIVCVAWLAVQLDVERAARRMIVLQEEHGTFGNFARGHVNDTLGMYFRTVDNRAARDAYARATQANPMNARYFNNLGNTELRLGRTSQALEALQAALDLGMRNWHVLYNVSLCELELGRPERALSFTDEFIERWPEKWQGFVLRGKARLDLGQLHEAQEDLRQALVLRPNDANIHYTLGLVLRDLGQFDEARRALERAVVLDPKHPQAQSALQRLSGER